jgi:hypothetical protein
MSAGNLRLIFFKRRVPGTGIRVTVAEVFAELDELEGKA